jgi:hypothetical protein
LFGFDGNPESPISINNWNDQDAQNLRESDNSSPLLHESPRSG